MSDRLDVNDLLELLNDRFIPKRPSSLGNTFQLDVPFSMEACMDGRAVGYTATDDVYLQSNFRSYNDQD